MKIGSLTMHTLGCNIFCLSASFSLLLFLVYLLTVISLLQPFGLFETSAVFLSRSVCALSLLITHIHTHVHIPKHISTNICCYETLMEKCSVHLFHAQPLQGGEEGVSYTSMFLETDKITAIFNMCMQPSSPCSC